MRGQQYLPTRSARYAPRNEGLTHDKGYGRRASGQSEAQTRAELHQDWARIADGLPDLRVKVGRIGHDHSEGGGEIRARQRRVGGEASGTGVGVNPQNGLHDADGLHEILLDWRCERVSQRTGTLGPKRSMLTVTESRGLPRVHDGFVYSFNGEDRAEVAVEMREPSHHGSPSERALVVSRSLSDPSALRSQTT